MAIKKGRPTPKIAPIIRPASDSSKRPRKLMDNQDTTHKGDSFGRDRVQMTFWVTPEKRAEMKAYAADHDMTVSRLIVEAINERMAK